MSERTPRDDAAKAAIAAGWQSSGLTQAAWAEKCGISSRTLRHYLKRYRPARHWDKELRATVEQASHALGAILKALEPSAEPPPEGRAAPTVQPASSSVGVTGDSQDRSASLKALGALFKRAT